MKGEFNRSLLRTITGIFILILILAVAYPPILRIVLSLLLVLFLPGYMLIVILFPRNSLGIPERLLLSIGSSMGITAVSGLILHWTTSRLRTTTLWGILLLWIMVEVAILVIAHDQWLSQTSRIFERNNSKLREWLSKTNNIFDGRKIEIRQWFSKASMLLDHKEFNLRRWLSKTNKRFDHSDFSLRQWGLLVLSASFIVIAILIARSPAPQQGLDGYTLLWIQPTEAPDQVRVGVYSQEFATTKYLLQFEADDVIIEGPTIELEPGETWEQSLSLPLDKLKDKPFTVLLYRLDFSVEIYRRVELWPETS